MQLGPRDITQKTAIIRDFIGGLPADCIKPEALGAEPANHVSPPRAPRRCLRIPRRPRSRHRRQVQLPPRRRRTAHPLQGPRHRQAHPPPHRRPRCQAPPRSSRPPLQNRHRLHVHPPPTILHGPLQGSLTHDPARLALHLHPSAAGLLRRPALRPRPLLPPAAHPPSLLLLRPTPRTLPEQRPAGGRALTRRNGPCPILLGGSGNPPPSSRGFQRLVARRRSVGAWPTRLRHLPHLGRSHRRRCSRPRTVRRTRPDTRRHHHIASPPNPRDTRGSHARAREHQAHDHVQPMGRVLQHSLHPKYQKRIDVNEPPQVCKRLRHAVEVAHKGRTRPHERASPALAATPRQHPQRR